MLCVDPVCAGRCGRGFFVQGERLMSCKVHDRWLARCAIEDLLSARSKTC